MPSLVSFLSPSRLLLAPVTLLLCTLFLGGCRERGSSLTHEVGSSAHDSAAVANQATAPQRDGDATEVATRTTTTESVRGPDTGGVQHGFADASGGHSLPHRAAGEADAQQRSNATATGRPELQEQIQRELADAVGSGLTDDQLAGLEVQVQGDRVVLSGEVPDAQTAEDLVARVQRMPGVARVESELRVMSAEPQSAE